MSNQLDREDLRAIMEFHLKILFQMLDQYVQDCYESSARRAEAQIAGLLFFAEGLGLVTEEEKNAYSKDAWQRYSRIYRNTAENRGTAP